MVKGMNPFNFDLIFDSDLYGDFLVLKKKNNTK